MIELIHGRPIESRTIRGDVLWWWNVFEILSRQRRREGENVWMQ